MNLEKFMLMLLTLVILAAFVGTLSFFLYISRLVFRKAREEVHWDEAWYKAMLRSRRRPTPKRNFAVTGRFQFDDEDVTLVFITETEQEAVALWQIAMHAADKHNENNLIVVSVAESKTPIKINYYGRI